MITYLATKTLPNDEKLSRFIVHQHDNFYLDENNLVYHVWSPTGRNTTATKPQLLIPGNLRFDILKAFHDNPIGCHLGHEKTYDKIRIIIIGLVCIKILNIGFALVLIAK